MNNRGYVYAVCVSLLIAGTFVSGCSTPGNLHQPRRAAFPNPRINERYQAFPTADSARIRPGLVITVHVLVAEKKEIEAQAKRVTDKGTIAMPLLGTLDINNLTLDELGIKLTASYKEYFVNPQVIVEFVRDDNKEGLSPWGSVTVLGRVKKPGKVSIPPTRDLTLSAAIQQAGGFDTSAKETAIRISHRLSNGAVKTREINLHSVGAEGLVEDDVLLEPDDVVFVPEMVF